MIPEHTNAIVIIYFNRRSEKTAEKFDIWTPWKVSWVKEDNFTCVVSSRRKNTVKFDPVLRSRPANLQP